MFGAIIDHFRHSKRRDIPEVRDVRDSDDQAFLEESRVVLAELEDVRQEKFKQYQWRKKISIPGVAVITPVTGFIDYWLLMLQRGSDDGAAGLTVVVLGAIYWWVTQPKRQYVKTYKERILPKIAALFGDFIYDVKGKVDVVKMQASRIFPSHDKYNSEDYFAGTYKGVGVEFSEIHLKERRRSGKKTRYVTVFKGLAILLDLKSKKFYGHTTLERDQGKVMEWFKERTRDLKRANLVDPEFEKMFDVYTNDQVEARYLIDPLMIERLKGLQEEYDGESMTAAFYESRMLVLIQSAHNYFEPADISVPATDPRSILSMKREVGEILGLIDRLDLYDPMAVHDQAPQAAS